MTNLNQILRENNGWLVTPAAEMSEHKLDDYFWFDGEKYNVKIALRYKDWVLGRHKVRRREEYKRGTSKFYRWRKIEGTQRTMVLRAFNNERWVEA